MSTTLFPAFALLMVLITLSWSQPGKAAPTLDDANLERAAGNVGNRLLAAEEHEALCPPMLLGCPPGTTQTRDGNDENGCPQYSCVGVSRCPPMLLGCPPGAKQTEDGIDENGCPQYSCVGVSRCPPYLLGCPPGTTQTEDGIDERGCPTYTCKA